MGGVIKKLLLSTAILALTAGAALARNAGPLLPPPPPPPMWTGFYAGLNAGYGQSVGMPWGPTLIGYTGDPAALVAVYSNTGIGQALSAWGPQNQNGFIGGAQVGYNYQWGSNFVIGLEADIQGAGIRGSSRGVGAGVGGASFSGSNNIGPYSGNVNFGSFGATNVNAGVDWMGTVRGRLGYLATPTLLVYATGGLTYGGVQANVTNYAVESGSSAQTQIVTPLPPPPPAPPPPPVEVEQPRSLPIGPFAGSAASTINMNYFGGGTKSQTLVGWNVGGGFEWMFMPNWSLKAEAIYWNMGNMTVRTASFAAAVTPLNTSHWSDIPSVVYGATRVNYQGVIARAGVNYHFNWGSAPIVAY